MTVNISVSVTDDTDSPVSGVSVSIGDVTGTTGSAGGCTLSNVPSGSTTVIATKDGYVEYNENISISTDTTSLSIVLTAGDSLTHYALSKNNDSSPRAVGYCILEEDTEHTGYVLINTVSTSNSSVVHANGQFTVQGDIATVADGETLHVVCDIFAEPLESGYYIILGV